MFAAAAHPRKKIEQYLWPGLPAARIDKADQERTSHDPIFLSQPNASGGELQGMTAGGA